MNKYLLCFSFALLFTPLFTHAFEAELVVDTGRETVNALEAILHIPRGVNIESVSNGNSAILIWIKSPTLDKQAETVSFSGITPGGFRGKQTILKLSGDFGLSDLPNFTFAEVQAIRGDGSGTLVPAKLALASAEALTDTALPEPFKPVVSRDVNLYDNQYFASFTTQDKGTGIERYDVASTWLLRPSESEWHHAESPMLITGRDKFKKIYIRAIDYSGNVRVVSTSGPYRSATLLIGTIIIVCVLLFFERRSLLVS